RAAGRIGYDHPHWMGGVIRRSRGCVHDTQGQYSKNGAQAALNPHHEDAPRGPLDRFEGGKAVTLFGKEWDVQSYWPNTDLRGLQNDGLSIIDLGNVWDFYAVLAHVFADFIQCALDDINFLVGMRGPKPMLRCQCTIAPGSPSFIIRQVDDRIHAIEQASFEFLGKLLSKKQFLVRGQLAEEVAHDDAAELNMTCFVAQDQLA